MEEERAMAEPAGAEAFGPPVAQSVPRVQRPTAGVQPSSAPAAARAGAFAADRDKCFAITLGTLNPSFLQRVRVWVWYFALPCVAVHRLGQWALNLRARHPFLGLPFVVAFFFVNFFVRLLRHVEISHRAEIGPAFHLGHPSSIFIGPTRIGANCNVTHNVTIGEGLGSQKPGIPVIGNNVWIGPGATITGGIVIGDGATISAGSIVTRDVPPGVLVAGNPARVVNARYDNRALLWPESVLRAASPADPETAAATGNEGGGARR
jgi:serine O-acetyltransferase